MSHCQDERWKLNQTENKFVPNRNKEKSSKNLLERVMYNLFAAVLQTFLGFDLKKFVLMGKLFI